MENECHCQHSAFICKFICNRVYVNSPFSILNYLSLWYHILKWQHKWHCSVSCVFCHHLPVTQLRQPALLSPLFCADCTSNHPFPCAFSTVLRHLSLFAGDISHYSFPCQTRIPPVQYSQTKRKRLPESRKSCGNTDKELKSYEKRNFPFWQVFERHGHAEHRCIYCMGLPHTVSYTHLTLPTIRLV